MEEEEAFTSSATPLKKIRRMCHYNKDWENKYSWITKANVDTRAYCKICRNEFAVAEDLKGEFFHAAKKRQDLKVCFEFYESKFKEVLRHVPTRWLSLFKALDRVLSSWGPLKKYFLELGVNNCSPAIWAIIKDQKDNPTTETNPTYTELYLYFTHNFMASFQEVLLLLENNDTLAFSLHNIMTQFRDTIVKKNYDEHFGMKVRMSMNKKYLSDEETQEFKKLALIAYQRAVAYLEKWFQFENSVFRSFSCLDLERGLPTLDQLIELWTLTRSNDTPPEALYSELAIFSSVYQSLEGKSVDMWCSFFSKESAPNLLKLVQHVCSIPVSNAFVERIFNVMGNIWTNERNRLGLETVKSELCVFLT
ncbi:unnamed protein product [Parnassius apollo]|uniref:(apollo) hypothetical protein n=1 Tax=Parnassius apollo TaxID=110799 RepID=A0A8S3XV99_PARAO|nr:unnamed protein product [Parnassius apollo]